MQLLREAFGQLGVGAEYAMAELSRYYMVQAVATLVVCVAAWVGAVAAVKRVLHWRRTTEFPTATAIAARTGAGPGAVEQVLYRHRDDLHLEAAGSGAVLDVLSDVLVTTTAVAVEH